MLISCGQQVLAAVPRQKRGNWRQRSIEPWPAAVARLANCSGKPSQFAPCLIAALTCVVEQQASASSALSKGDSSDDDDGSASMSMSEENRCFARRCLCVLLLPLRMLICNAAFVVDFACPHNFQSSYPCRSILFTFSLPHSSATTYPLSTPSPLPPPARGGSCASPKMPPPLVVAKPPGIARTALSPPTHV